MGIICATLVSRILLPLDEALQGDKKRFDWQSTTAQRALTFGREAMKCGAARNSNVYNDPLLALNVCVCVCRLTRLNTAKITMTVVVMVARGRRTHGRFTTASDTAGSHWHLDSFSGNRRCRGEGEGELPGKTESNRYEEHVTLAQSFISRHHVWVTQRWLFPVKESGWEEKTQPAKDWMSGVTRQVRRLAIESFSSVKAGDSFHDMFPFTHWLILARWNTWRHRTTPFHPCLYLPSTCLM